MILDEIANTARGRVAHAKKICSAESIRVQALSLPKGDFLFENALKRPGMSFICEVKKASPSKGVISQDFPYLEIARDYEKAGAAAISVLTEPEYFLGSDRYLSDIVREVSVPVLRKDFTVDPYQIYEAKIIGASAVLLICSLLDAETLKEYISICDAMGISALVEAHTEDEVHLAVQAGARIIGVNNRNLKTFDVDFSQAVSLKAMVPDHVAFVAESGVQSPADMEALGRAKIHAVLIGETLMRAPDRCAALKELCRGYEAGIRHEC